MSQWILVFPEQCKQCILIPWCSQSLVWNKRCMSINLLPAVSVPLQWVCQWHVSVSLQLLFSSSAVLVLPECTVCSLQIWFTLKFCTVINTRRPKSLTQRLPIIRIIKYLKYEKEKFHLNNEINTGPVILDYILNWNISSL